MLAMRLPLRLGRAASRTTRPTLSAIVSVQSARPSLTIARTFASSGRPKKPASEKKTRQKPAAKAPSKDATTKKPTAKKAAPKPKLTEEQLAQKKAKAKELKAKNELKHLKEQALSPSSSGRKVTTYSIFVQDRSKGKKIAQGQTVISLAKENASAWKSLSSTEREHYNHLTNEYNRQRVADYQKWVQSHSPNEIRLANLARKRLRTLLAKGSTARWAPIKDDREIKRPVTAYLLYNTERQRSGDFRGISIPQRAKDIAGEYKALSASEKKHYEDLQKRELERYHKEYRAVYGVDPPIGRSRSSASA